MQTFGGFELYSHRECTTRKHLENERKEAEAKQLDIYKTAFKAALYEYNRETKKLETLSSLLDQVEKINQEPDDPATREDRAQRVAEIMSRIPAMQQLAQQQCNVRPPVVEVWTDKGNHH